MEIRGKECFISNSDATCLNSFVKKASRVVPNILTVKLRNDEKWGRYIFDKCDHYRSSDQYQQKTLVTALGKQPYGSVWILSKEIHINASGLIIPEEEQSYYWDDEYCREHGIRPLNITLPLDSMGFSNLLQSFKRALSDNFLSSVIAICSTALLGHYEMVMERFHECPIPLLYSKETGTGKSSSAKAALCCWGAQNVNFRGCKSSVSSIVNYTSKSTIPVVVDDVCSQHSMEELAVQFSGGASHSTISSGNTAPRAGIIVTSNMSFIESDRNVVRLVHIPFSKIYIDREEHRSHLEDDHKIACDRASSSIGLFIAIGSVLESQEFNDDFHSRFLPMVREIMTDLPNRAHRSYALVLAVTNELCKNVSSSVVSFQDVEEFFKRNLAPRINSILKPSSKKLDDFCEELLKQIADLEVYEILRFLRPDVINKSTKEMFVNIAFSYMRKHVEFDEKELRRMVVSANGKTGASLPFLKDDSTDMIVKPSANVGSKVMLHKDVEISEEDEVALESVTFRETGSSMVSENDEREEPLSEEFVNPEGSSGSKDDEREEPLSEEFVNPEGSSGSKDDEREEPLSEEFVNPEGSSGSKDDEREEPLSEEFVNPEGSSGSKNDEREEPLSEEFVNQEGSSGSKVDVPLCKEIEINSADLGQIQRG
uniref:DUF927 domain-containing protein n=1 Tax=Amphimedon queenslandica TaxID=400682 RepID=A0A1X7TLC2_AMPQE